MRKNNFIVALATIFVWSCGSSKQATTTTQTYQKSTEVTSTTQGNSSMNQPARPIDVSPVAQQAIDNQAPVAIEMLDWGYARSGDRAKAQRDALKAAQNNIVIRLYRSISSVDQEFGQDITIGEKITSETKRSDMIIGIVDKKTATISYTKQPTVSRENGIYEVEVEVKLTPELLNSITSEIYNSLSSEDELKVKFDEQQFFENVYKAQLDAYRAEQNEKK